MLLFIWLKCSLMCTCVGVCVGAVFGELWGGGGAVFRELWEELCVGAVAVLCVGSYVGELHVWWFV